MRDEVKSGDGSESTGVEVQSEVIKMRRFGIDVGMPDQLGFRDRKSTVAIRRLAEWRTKKRGEDP